MTKSISVRWSCTYKTPKKYRIRNLQYELRRPVIDAIKHISCVADSDITVAGSPSPAPSEDEDEGCGTGTATSNHSGSHGGSHSSIKKGGRQKRGVLPKQATSIMRTWLFEHLVVSIILYNRLQPSLKSDTPANLLSEGGTSPLDFINNIQLWEKNCQKSKTKFL